MAAPKQFSLLFSLFRLILIFAATLTDITVASHNLHGYKKSANYHKSCLQTFGGIWMAQELWLTEQQIPTLQQLGTQFVARSGMEDAVASGILRGRPFGGVSISWSPNLNHLVTPLANYRHKRVVAVELKTEMSKCLFISVYMPFYNPAKREECMLEAVDALSMMETIIEEHPQHLVVIGGDLNTEMKGGSPFDAMWADLMLSHHLSCCDNLVPTTTPPITYHHESLGQKKWNDHFLVSNGILSGGLSKNHDILDEGGNVSDHLPIIMKLSFSLSPNKQKEKTLEKSSSLKWEKITKEQKNNYTSCLSDLLDSSKIQTPVFQCPRRCHCDDVNCHEAIQSEYDNLTQLILKADAVLPRHKPGIQKDWWTTELTELRTKSIEIHALWIDEGRPRQGPTHMERLRVRASYKKAIRAAQRSPKQASWNRLHSSMVTNDTDSFWKSWRTLYSKNKSHCAPVVDGVSTKEGIAAAFKNSFQGNAKPNNKERVEDLNRRFKVDYETYSAKHSKNCDCKSHNVSLQNVIDSVFSMKPGKCADEEKISAEHFLNGPFNLFVRLKILFTSMLSHSFVPKQFRFGFMIPIIKDHQGNHGDVGNYRGITISPIISKVFEHVLRIVFSDYMLTSSYQFGFKKGASTVHALHCLKETINYYVDNGSRVYCSFLDASKAFDRLVHSGLFLKLMERDVPKMFLDIIIVWYDGLYCRVKWEDCLSDWFLVSAGVRQGGVLSPDFYCIYVDDLIVKLKHLNVGCHILGMFAAALFYADDMAILSPSIKGLQTLLDVCGNYCSEWDICLNAKKSKNMYFGKKCSLLHKVSLDGKFIDWVDSWVYLGVSLVSGKRFGCSVSNRIRKFYKCANAIFRVEGRSDDLTMLRLIESHCVPLLTYAIEIVHITDQSERSKLRVAYNSVFRKIFGYRYYESVTELQGFLSRMTWEELVEKRRVGFLKRTNMCTSDSLVWAFRT